ncbi:MAG TPA: aminotransferase class IV [Acidimicrobiia bacterium]|nr:aminotransferase class IV [Acidimicrobiia bacterium]
MTSTILINGQASDDGVAVTDSSVLRGDGCFEVLKAYGGVPFALDPHLDRLERSAVALGIELPARADISRWIERVANECPDCAIRVVVTRGSALPDEHGAPVVIVFAHPWSGSRGPARLLPVAAPWHAAGAEWDLAGAKILSYAPNLSASRRASRAGFDDALLTTVDGLILEGPTFCVAWVVDDVLETPSLDLGILDSITRRLVLEDADRLGVRFIEGRWSLDRLEEASEVMAMSTIREVQPVSVVGHLAFGEGPITSDLARAFAQRIR